MKTVLAFDCSFGGHSVAVQDAEHGTLASCHHPRIYPARGITESLDRSLRSAGIDLSDIDFIAFGAGPGLFSGIRAACTAAQGVGFVHKLPIVAVPTSLAIASDCAKKRALVVYPAHRGHCYISAFECIRNTWRHAFEPALAAIGDIPEFRGDWELCGRRLHLFETACRKAVAGDLKRLPSQRGSLAPSVGRSALEIVRKHKKRLLEAKQAQPCYVRMKVAYTKKERLAMLPKA